MIKKSNNKVFTWEFIKSAWGKQSVSYLEEYDE